MDLVEVPQVNTQSFGPYELIHMLGAGGMAEAWLARVAGRPAGDEFVIKRLLAELSSSEESVQAFREEAALASRLVHPNIVRTLEADAIDGRTFMPLELVFGDDLSDLVRKSMAVGRFPSDAFLAHVIAQAARGLHYAHTLTSEDGEPLELVHRDISPPNIMVGMDGVARVLDFGVAQLRPGMSDVRAGQLRGKFAYMSPEQAIGREVDNRSDVFALGTVLFELVTRKRLFRADSPLKTVRNVSRAMIPDPGELRPDFPEPLRAPLMKSLARSPGARQQSADEFADQLLAAVEEMSPGYGVEDVAKHMRAVCVDVVDGMKRLVGADYSGPRPLDELDIPRSGDGQLSLAPQQQAQPADDSGTESRYEYVTMKKTPAHLRGYAIALTATIVAVLGFITWLITRG